MSAGPTPRLDPAVLSVPGRLSAWVRGGHRRPFVEECIEALLPARRTLLGIRARAERAAGGGHPWWAAAGGGDVPDAAAATPAQHGIDGGASPEEPREGTP